MGKDCPLPAYLHSLATHVPPFVHRQTDLSALLQEQFEDERVRRLAAQATRKSGIETRNLVVEGFFDCPPFDERGQAGTAERNAVYETESRRLAVELGEKILSRPGAPQREEITHVVFASCTGFVNPGPDFWLVRDLGLPESTERYTIGFMGCYAAFPALRMAAQFCEADARARVLVICLELCSLHMQIDAATDSILGNTVFADGAAGGIVTSRPGDGETFLELERFATATIPDGESAMAWSIGNAGFDLVLSGYVPRIIGANIGEILERTGCEAGRIDRYAVHPGGKAILDRVESSLGLPDDALRESRDVLRECGNMSSPTILFVLERILRDASGGESILAVAFGPGLTVETAELLVRGTAPTEDGNLQPPVSR